MIVLFTGLLGYFFYSYAVRWRADNVCDAASIIETGEQAAALAWSGTRWPYREARFGFERMGSNDAYKWQTRTEFSWWSMQHEWWVVVSPRTTELNLDGREAWMPATDVIFARCGRVIHESRIN